MRTTRITAFALTLCLSPSAFASGITDPAASATRPATSRAASFQAKLDEMQDLLAQLRASQDPAKRRHLLHAHARTVQEAIWLSSAGHDYRRPPVVSPRPMPGQPAWRYRDPIRTAGLSKAQPEGTPAQQRHKGPARYELLQSQLQDLAQRLDAQQLVLDEILRYREPIERLLGQLD